MTLNNEGKILRCEPGSEATISNKKAEKAKKERARANGAVATRPEVKVRGYEAHVLVCGGGDCKKRGAKEVRKSLKAELRERGRVRGVRIDSVECLGLCKHGPNAVVYPGGAWYLGLQDEDVPEVVGRHLEGGEPTGRHAARFGPLRSKK